MIEKPDVKHFQYSLKTLVIAVILAGIYVGLLIERQVNYPKRNKERAVRAASANNLEQMGCALSIYEGGSDRYPNDPLIKSQAHNQFPDDPAALWSADYCADFRVFINPRFPEQDVGYIYISGSTSATPLDIVMYENVSEDRSADGRHILLANGSVEWTAGEGFENKIKKTEDAIRAAGGNPKRIPISRADLEKRRKQ